MPKLVFGAWYAHREYLQELPPEGLTMYEAAWRIASPRHEWNVVRVSPRQRRVTFSLYPNFFGDPHPMLVEWTTISLDEGTVRRCRSKSINSMILHRKETFIGSSDPRHAIFARLSEQEELAGLYASETIRQIGRRSFWETLLLRKGLEIVGHELRAVL